MKHLRVINSILKDKPDYYALYSTAFINQLESADVRYKTVEQYDKDTLKKLILLGVKTVVAIESRKKDKDSLTLLFSIISFVNSLMELLTPREFETIFPIDKVYDGERWEMKDYFYTRKYIEEFGIDKIIGKDIDEFLWEYSNWTIGFYLVEQTGVASDLRKLETGKGIMEEFLEEQGGPTYSMYEGVDGKQYIENRQTGEVSEVKKPRPRYLRVVENEK
ncbi:hypothetical protein ACIQ6U_12215 [Lysinibacillus fusiformis]|uniref:hypothetical protein n=1 Tax=Lysinibacillus fusiformis TaxID=28031 RepID=UPI00380AB8EF